jgi:hypothetical protein
MKFNSQICTTKEQSERLLALGLKAETADMRYILFEGDLEPCIRAMPWNSICIPCQNNFPAWSLHRLIEMMPEAICESKDDDYHYFLSIETNSLTWKVFYESEDEVTLCSTFGEELIDALYDMVVKLKEEGVI